MDMKQPKSSHPLYNIWKGMHYRCYNPSFPQWADYGGRGIRVCERWHSFGLFIADMGEKPLGHTLDRIDNLAGYSPDNCRWATRKEQQRNQRVTRLVSIRGITYKAADLADMSGLKTDTIVSRANNGLSLEDVMSAKRRIFADGLRLGGKASGAKKQELTHCKRGHEFTPENTHITKQGWRRCRRCHADAENLRRLSNI